MSDPLILSREILVPAGFALTILGTAFGGLRWLERRLDRIEQQNAMLELHLTDIRRVIRVGMQARWTALDMRLWSEDLRDKNTTLNLVVPEPKHVPQPGEE